MRKTLAVVAAGVSLAAAAALPAAGAAHHPSNFHTFKTTLSTSTVQVGHKIVIKGTGAEKNGTYICQFVIVRGSSYGIGPIQGTITATHKGNVKCIDASFQAYHAKVGSTVRHCPPTKAENKAGFKCGYAIWATGTDDKSKGTSYFTATK